jgi:hypothetical protein
MLEKMLQVYSNLLCELILRHGVPYTRAALSYLFYGYLQAFRLQTEVILEISFHFSGFLRQGAPTGGLPATRGKREVEEVH